MTTPHQLPWMQTFSGQQFWPLLPMGEIKFIDIAHALSMICRYGGHTKSFYSVAQHCVLASHMVPAEHAKWALLHDAAEAYLGDIVRPIKKSFGFYVPDRDFMVTYEHCEANLLSVIGERFGLEWPLPVEVIEEVDLRLLMSERAALMNAPPAPWGVFQDLEPDELARLKSRTVPILPLSQTEAKSLFCSRAVQLGLVDMHEAFPLPC